jgi:hypothetical protein
LAACKTNIMLKDGQTIGLVGIAMAVFVVSNLVGRSGFVSAMSSENFGVVNDSLNFGGGAAESTSYSANDTLGDIATAEGLSSENYEGCAGFQCFDQVDFLSFSVTQGLSYPGSEGAGVAFGDLSADAVSTSNGTSINSVFITANSNTAGGFKVTVTDEHAGLASLSSPSTRIESVTATLQAGTAGFGICVETASENADSPSLFNVVTPYNGSCNKTANHEVGIVDTTSRTILQSAGVLRGGTAEILLKTAISSITPAGSDYSDTLTFIATATY